MQSMLLTKWLILGKVIHNTEFAYDVQNTYNVGFELLESTTLTGGVAYKF